MNQIIKNYLEVHIKEYGIENLKETTAFEHFINRCIINKYSPERFDPNDIMLGDGEIGLDGIGIVVNDLLITDKNKELIDEISNHKQKLKVKFIMIQTKSSENFDGGDFGTFTYGVKNFFEPSKNREKMNIKIQCLAKIKDEIYLHSLEFDGMPILEMYYVCCGKWDNKSNLESRRQMEQRYLDNTGYFSKVNIYMYDNDKIMTAYKELRKKISNKFKMEKKISFPQMDGIEQAYFGLIRCNDFIEILKDAEGNKLNNIFEDNVRDFQGYTPVNNEIKETIKNDEQEKFAILNNGITIIAGEIKTKGDEVEIFDYQIVNGCQSSYVLFDNSSFIKENSYIIVKLIQSSNKDILDRIIYTTNRQTEVKSEAFASTKKFHKTLEEFYNSLNLEDRLYYERRSKQYELNETVSKNKVITLATQIYSYISMFFNEPHSTHRYYGELLNAYSKKIFQDDDLPDPYYYSSYFLFEIDKRFSNNSFKIQYKKFRFHILCALKGVVVGSKVVDAGSKNMKQICKKFKDIIQKNETEKYLTTAYTCFKETIELSGSDFMPQEIYRNKEFTNRLLEKADSYCKECSSNLYLRKGDVVQCIVAGIKPHYIIVELKIEDARKNGTIHISQIADRYIPDITKEVRLGDYIQAKIINDDYYTNWYGWQLSMMIQ